MNKFLLGVIVLLVVAQPMSGQDEKSNRAAAIAGGALALGSAILEYHLFLEMLENEAFNFIAQNHPEMDAFRLKVLDLEGKKMSDIGAMTVLTFRITHIDKLTGNELNRSVLMMYTSSGWMNEFGIDHDLVTWKALTKSEWNQMYGAFLNLNSRVQVMDDFTYYESIPLKKKEYNSEDSLHYCLGGDCYRINPDFRHHALVASFGRKGLIMTVPDQYGNAVENLSLPFYPLKNDDYLVADFSHEFRLFANERAMGIFVKATGRSIQLQRSLVSKIHGYVNEVSSIDAW